MYPVGSWLRFLEFLRARGSVSGSRAALPANVIFLGLTSLLTDISSEMVISVLPIYLITILRLTPAQFGLIDGLYQGVAALVQLASGVLTDRLRSYKEVAAIGYALSAICRLGLLATTTAGGIASVLVIDRLGKGIRTAPRDSLLSLSVPKGQLGFAFGVHRAMDAMGAMTGPILAFALLALLPGAFDVLFVTSFCIALIGLSALLVFVENQQPIEEAAPAAVSGTSTRWLLADAGFRRLFICATLLSLTTLSDAFVYLVLQRELNLGAGSFPLLYVATSLSYLLLAAPAGWVADRIGRMRVFAAAYALLLIIYAALLWGSPSIPVLVAVLLMLGAYYAGTDGVLMALGSAILPAGVRATGLASLATATAVARFGASASFGLLWTWFGLEPAVSVFAVALVGVLALTLLIFPRGVARD
jgi:MFS family permease